MLKQEGGAASAGKRLNQTGLGGPFDFRQRKTGTIFA
jgi:hypothetical protein